MEFKGKEMIEFIKKLFSGHNKEESLKSLLLPEPTATPKVEEHKKTPKEIATENKEPWIAVLNTHVNKDDIRNGFFELDWNEYFVLQLRVDGYQGDTDESIVDQWFQDLCRNIGSEAGVNMERRGSGYVNRALRDDGRTEIS